MSERKSQWELFLESEEEEVREKRCSRCKKYKPVSEFSKAPRRKYGVNSDCKECHNERFGRKYRDRVDRFWKWFHAHTIPVGGCLVWTACPKTAKPRCEWYGKRVFVARLVYQLSRGEVPDGMFVIHKCNNQRCMRQSHLLLSTKEDVLVKANNNAAWGENSPSRLHRESRPRGEQHWRTTLTAADIRDIRNSYKRGVVSSYALADRFGVSKTTILGIVHGKTWSHVE